MSHEICGAVLVETYSFIDGIAREHVVRGRLSALAARRIAESLVYHADQAEKENDALSDLGADVAAGQLTTEQAIVYVARAVR